MKTDLNNDQRLVGATWGATLTASIEAIPIEYEKTGELHMTLDEYVEPDIPVIGALPPRELLETLEEIGDDEAAARLREGLEQYDNLLEPRADFGFSLP